eukprot:TRINITY_DN1071_c0_g1_i4.p5 TRINITY_DN1071_c0_g1~~TRINITY_DN1071_c0_g1_i4.p5  ORF type:complete len:548 (-),score=46.71 TRINITY_DN1071_c0_g1_i4:11847-13490(-)
MACYERFYIFKTRKMKWLFFICWCILYLLKLIAKMICLKQAIVYLLTFLIVGFVGCSYQKESGKSQKVIVSGLVLNHDKYPNNYTVKIFDKDPIDLYGKSHTAFINDDGSFTIEFDKLFPSDVYLVYGRSHLVFVSPGDSIHVEMEASAVIDSKDETSLSSLKFSGSNKRLNEEITLFRNSLHTECSFDITYHESTLAPEEFLNYMKEVKKKQEEVLNSLLLKRELSEDFIRWSKHYIDYNFAACLFHYTWYSLFFTKKDKKFEVIDIPESYYAAMKNIPVSNSEAIISSNYQHFLHEYSLTNTEYKSVLFEKMKESRGKFKKTELFQKEFEAYLQMFTDDYNGIAYEILISRQFLALLNYYKRIDVFESLYPEYKNTLGRSFCEVLDEKYSQAKLQEKEKITDNSVLKNRNATKRRAEDILKKITEKNKGKMICLDFWATWCGPCLMEFKHSKKLAEKFKGEDIEFVYLCIKSDKDKWEEKVREYNLSGNQYLLTDSEYDVLSEKFQIVGIPHFVLIDKNGKVIEKNAPHPSSGDDLVSLIKEHIN